MRIPFLQRVTVKKITGDTTAPGHNQAAKLLEGLLQDLPELLLALVVDVRSGHILAAYTAQTQLNPHKISASTTNVAQQLANIATMPGFVGQQLVDHVTVLNNQLHVLRLTPDQQRGCLLVVHPHDTNLALVREVLRMRTEQ